MSKRLEMLEAMLAKGSEDPFVWYAHAMELRSIGRLPEALDRFDRVRERFPTYVPTYLMGGQVAEQLSEPATAKQYYEAGLTQAQQTGDAHATAELRTALEALDLR